MIKDILCLDEKDMKLCSLVMKDPTMSQQSLANQLELSQPSVNLRLRKLKEKGILEQEVGIDPKKAGLSMARVDFTCNDADRILRILKECSFFVNGFVMSGTRNVCVFLVGENLNKIEHIVTQYLRKNSLVSNIEVSVTVATAKKFVCSIDLEKEHNNACQDPHSCEDCTILHQLH